MTARRCAREPAAATGSTGQGTAQVSLRCAPGDTEVVLREPGASIPIGRADDPGQTGRKTAVPSPNPRDVRSPSCHWAQFKVSGTGPLFVSRATRDPWSAPCQPPPVVSSRGLRPAGAGRDSMDGGAVPGARRPGVRRACVARRPLGVGGRPPGRPRAHGASAPRPQEGGGSCPPAPNPRLPQTMPSGAGGRLDV